MRTTKTAVSYQIDLVPDEDGGFTVMAPALPGCVSYGDTIKAAMRNAREAIELHLENLRAHKDRIPRWSPENQPYAITSKPANEADPEQKDL